MITTEERTSKFSKITSEMLDLHIRKNTDYGDSFDNSLDEDGLLVAKIRLGDKFSRFSSLIKNPALVSDESIRDTLVDMANYAIMTIMWMESLEEATSMELVDVVKQGLGSSEDITKRIQKRLT